MNYTLSLNELIGNKALVKLIFFFIKNPTSEFSQTELRRKVKLSKATATKWLDKLVKNYFIILKERGVMKLYRLNAEDTLIKQLKILDNLGDLREIRKISEKINAEAYLYGSSSRGEDVEGSDIDLFLLGKVKKEDIIGDIEKLSLKINRNINVEIFTQVEWSQMARKDPAFYERVEKDKIRL